MTTARDLGARWPALDVAGRRARLQNTVHFSPGPLADAIISDTPAAERAAAALWRRDPAGWSSDAAVQEKIANRLGWLTSPGVMADALDRLCAFGESVRLDRISDVVLLGMGGSSLAPEVLRSVLGVAPGWPRFHMLDSTDPGGVRAAATPPERTLYLLASKSGTTVEPNVLAAHFRHELEHAGVTHWARHFVAITDEGTPLAARARTEGFRDLFINPGDIGGRYSAMSYFGLVPAALMGQNVSALVGWALAMLEAAEPGFGAAATNPAIALGLAIGSAARAGRDKLTLILQPALKGFGLWIEQLIAESTGKLGTGIVPIAGERLGPPSEYDHDRFFARIRIRGSYAEEMLDTDIRELKAAKQPVAEIELAGPSALAAEFVRWEIATAVAGALLTINPFDEPNVQQAKDATKGLLDRYKANGRLPAPSVDKTAADGTEYTLTAAARNDLDDRAPESILTLLRRGDYLAILGYVPYDVEMEQEIAMFRAAVRKRVHVATMTAYGPRYLHSTGQLHKGGPNTGVFIIVTATPREDLSIPGEPYTFGTLELAQALGDFASLDATGRRALHVHLPAADRQHVRAVLEALMGRVRND